MTYCIIVTIRNGLAWPDGCNYPAGLSAAPSAGNGTQREAGGL